MMVEGNNNNDFKPKSGENIDSKRDVVEPKGDSDSLIQESDYSETEFTDDDVDPIAITRDFRNIRLYLQIAGICGPLSLIIGGILLGTVALIFAILAFRKIMKYAKRQDELGMQARYVRKFAILALIICAGCLVANIVFVVTYMPQLSEMFTSGATGAPASSGSSSGGTSSTWG